MPKRKIQKKEKTTIRQVLSWPEWKGILLCILVIIFVGIGSYNGFQRGYHIQEQAYLEENQFLSEKLTQCYLDLRQYDPDCWQPSDCSKNSSLNGCSKIDGCNWCCNGLCTLMACPQGWLYRDGKYYQKQYYIEDGK